MKIVIGALAVSALVCAVGPADARGGGGGSGGGGNHSHGDNGSQSGTEQPNHGPGSSHNPIIYHPVHGPGSSHNPIVAAKPVVRDHRGGIYRPYRPPYRPGYNGSASGGVTVTNSSGQVVPSRLNGASVYPNRGRGGGGFYRPPPPIVHDHR